MKTEIEICAICGSDEIQQKEWVEIKSGITKGICGDDADLVYCPICEKEVETKSIDVFLIHTKGDLMKAVYSEEELERIDCSLPIQYWKNNPNFETVIHVMNYNEPNTMGRVENMEHIAKARGIKFKWI